jgi:hypothetical protein
MPNSLGAPMILFALRLPLNAVDPWITRHGTDVVPVAERNKERSLVIRLSRRPWVTAHPQRAAAQSDDYTAHAVMRQ